ncbi:MAG TPA: 30S ribosomal protein S9 [Myxococcota bacterium]|nr:30S ribosomal protein S9 [Myxococcota bacterium]
MARNIVQYYGTGRRKSATARVYLRPGSGRFLANGRPLEDYIPREILRMDIRRPLEVCEVGGNFDVHVNVSGGGPTGQAGAMRLGVARALLAVSPEFRGRLKPLGLLTRDSREVERKKYGRRGARRSFQFSKR